MSITFNKERALEAVKTFEALCADKNFRKINTAKSLIVCTLLAYFGGAKLSDIEKQLGHSTKMMKDLVDTGYVVSDKRTIPYIFSINKNKVSLDKGRKVPDDVSLLFTNVLFNIRSYINDYNIKAWNPLALALETTLKVGYSSQYISLHTDDINSIPGQKCNKVAARKALVDLGFIQEKASAAKNNFYRLNKRAYLLGANV